MVNATSVKGQKEMMTQIASKIPVIYIDTSVPGTGTTSVQSDNLTIGRESGKITAKRFLGMMARQNIKMVILTGPAHRRVRRTQPAPGLSRRPDRGWPEVRDQGQSSPVTTNKTRARSRPENMLAANPGRRPGARTRRLPWRWAPTT